MKGRLGQFSLSLEFIDLSGNILKIQANMFKTFDRNVYLAPIG